MKYSLSKLAIVLVLMIIFFAIVTQRMMITSDSKLIESAKTLLNEIEMKIGIFSGTSSSMSNANNIDGNSNDKANTNYPSDILKEVLHSKETTDIDDILIKGEDIDTFSNLNLTSISVDDILANEEKGFFAEKNKQIITDTGNNNIKNTKVEVIPTLEPSQFDSSIKDSNIQDKVFEYDELLQKNSITPPKISSPSLRSEKSQSLSKTIKKERNDGMIQFLTEDKVAANQIPIESNQKEKSKVSKKSIEYLNNENYLSQISKNIENSIKFKDKSTSFLNKNRSKELEMLSLEDLQNMQVIRNHPFYSPRNGTNIDSQNQISVLMCPNQSKCIVPDLQLTVRFKIYFCKHVVKSGVRYYFLAREGLLLHPNVDLVTNISEADFIVYLPGSAPWHLTECSNASYGDKLIVLDEFDGSTLFWGGGEDTIEQRYGKGKTWYYIYFKRSFVRRSNGTFIGYPTIDFYPDVYPLTYSIAEAYVQPNKFNFQREIDILCTLRGSLQMQTRLRVQTWIAEYGETRSVQNIITKQLSTASRTQIDRMYFQRMYNTKIIVTVNPMNWEGDFRLWEAMASGALIFVDPLNVLHPFPLESGVHLIYFSNSNKTDLFTKLDYYRSHPEEARKIAINGYLHAMKYHRTVSSMDYILRSVHMKMEIEKASKSIKDVGLVLNKIPSYTYTAQELNKKGKVIQRYMREQERIEKEKLAEELKLKQAKDGLIHFGRF